MTTKYDTEISKEVLVNHIGYLINKFYKILPLKENNEPTILQYMEGLQREMLGCKSLMPVLEKKGQYLSVVSILQYMIDNDCDVQVVRSDVFKILNILKNMKTKIEKS